MILPVKGVPSERMFLYLTAIVNGHKQSWIEELLPRNYEVT